MPGWTLADLRILLGEDLSEGSLRDVVAELQRIQSGYQITQTNHAESLLQGDIYGAVGVVERRGNHLSIEHRRAMLVSNSCDVDRRNARDLPVSVTIAPVMRLSRFRQMLLDSDVDEDRIASIVQSLKVQELSTMLYVPVGSGVQEPLVVMLSNVQSMSIDEFNTPLPNREAVLTARGFWLLVIKLAMHFCRPYEAVERDAA